MKQINLIMVTENNNNKFYNMQENEDGTFSAKWGRVGATKNTTIYPIEKWEKQYNSKIKKGYKDISSLKTESKVQSYKDLNDKEILNFLLELQKYSKQSLLENYTVSSKSVTKAQVDEAQNILNKLSKYMTPKKFNRYEIDTLLKELYITIPRKMKKVQDFLINGEGDLKKAKQILIREQDSIDNMSQAVSMNQTDNTDEKEITIEDALNIKVEHITDEDKEIILKKMGKNANQFKKAYKIINTKSQPKFDAQRNKSHKHWTKLLWHGSRNENWLNILKTSLMIRPTCAVFTGAMFGDGVYFADKCQKSVGYTSLRGSYWTSGSDKKGFIALYEVNTGKELRTQSRESWMSNLTEKKLKARGDYDSLFAKGGVDLINNEYIIYNQNQCTIKYIVEIA